MALFLFFSSPCRIARSRISAEVVTGAPEFQVHALEGETSGKVGPSGPGTYCTRRAKTEDRRRFRRNWHLRWRLCCCNESLLLQSHLVCRQQVFSSCWWKERAQSSGQFVCATPRRGRLDQNIVLSRAGRDLWRRLCDRPSYVRGGSHLDGRSDVLDDAAKHSGNLAQKFDPVFLRFLCIRLRVVQNQLFEPVGVLLCCERLARAVVSELPKGAVEIGAIDYFPILLAFCAGMLFDSRAVRCVRGRSIIGPRTSFLILSVI
jgi:hypothetical protein